MCVYLPNLLSLSPVPTMRASYSLWQVAKRVKATEKRLKMSSHSGTKAWQCCCATANGASHSDLMFSSYIMKAIMFEFV